MREDPRPAVRSGTEGDVEGAARVLQAAYEQYKDAFPERYEIYIADVVDVSSRWATSELLIATIDDRIAGCVNFYPDASLADYPAAAKAFPPDWAAIRLLAVDPAFRSRGIGRFLTDACIDRARTQGAPTVGLHTTEAMDVARKMYEKMGFERISDYDFYPTPSIAVLAYRLNLYDA